MKKITVFDFCRQIGAASDEIPVVVQDSRCGDAGRSGSKD